MDEMWKDIPGYEGIYQASCAGEIRSAPGKTTSNKLHQTRVWKSRVLKTKTLRHRNRKDEAISLWKDGVCKYHLVSRLIAMTWVDGYDPKLTVNHIDGDETNNHADNLEWVSRSENIRKGFDDGLYDGVRKKTVLTDQYGDHEFSSMKSASQFLHRSKGYVSNCVKNGHPIKAADGTVYTIRAIEGGA